MMSASDMCNRCFYEGILADYDPGSITFSYIFMGNIGILGVDKDGEEWYQVTIGGAQGNRSALGKVIGPSFRAEEMPAVIERIVTTYCNLRVQDEPFIDTVTRVGLDPFKVGIYGQLKAVA